MARVTIALTGVKELDAKLKALSRVEGGAKNIGKITRQATRFAAKVVEPSVKREVMRDAYDTGELYRSIKVRALKRSRRRQGHTIQTHMFSGETFYGGFLEWGWKTGKRGSANRKQIEGRFMFLHGARSKYSRAIAAFRAHLNRGITEVMRGT